MKEPLDFKQLRDFFFPPSSWSSSPFCARVCVWLYYACVLCVCWARGVAAQLAVREDGLVLSHAQNINELETRRGNKDARRITRGNYTPPLDSCLCSFENNLNIKYLK